MNWIKFLLVVFFFAGCGRDIVRTKYVPVPTGDSGGGGGPVDRPPAPNGDKPSYGETQALLNNYCLKCHANAAFMESEKGLLASQAKQRVWNKSMPPNQNDLPDAEREKILAFFQ